MFIFVEYSCSCLNVSSFVVAAQLSRKTGGTPHSEIFWQFLHHCLDAFPECFVSLEPQSAHDAMSITGASHSTVHVQGNKICRSGKGKQFLEKFRKGWKIFPVIVIDGPRPLEAETCLMLWVVTFFAGKGFQGHIFLLAQYLSFFISHMMQVMTDGWFEPRGKGGWQWHAWGEGWVGWKMQGNEILLHVISFG